MSTLGSTLFLFLSCTSSSAMDWLPVLATRLKTTVFPERTSRGTPLPAGIGFTTAGSRSSFLPLWSCFFLFLAPLRSSARMQLTSPVFLTLTSTGSERKVPLTRRPTVTVWKSGDTRAACGEIKVVCGNERKRN